MTKSDKKNLKMFRKGKSTSPRKDKSPRSPSTSQGGDGVTSPRGILSSSTKGATLKLSRKMKVNMDECEGLIRSPAEDVLTVGRKKGEKRRKKEEKKET